MMVSARAVLASLALLIHCASAQEGGWITNQVSATMCQWPQPRVGVIRDTVYMDGGYLWWTPGMADGSYGTPRHDGNPLGLVYTLNFSTPFNTSSNFSQIFKTISKAPSGGAVNNFAPEYFDGAMFANDNEFYTYGGLVARTDAFQPPAENSVLGYEKYWYGTAGKQFTSGFLSGTTTNGTTRYVSYGAGVSVPSENLGFYFSGMRSKSSGPIFYTTSNAALNADTISNTLISVDMTTQRSEKWTNQTLPTYVPGRANAELVWVPVGKKGVLIAIGGVIQPEFAFANHSLNANQTAESQVTSPTFMSTVSVYDIDSGSWYEQETEGGPGQLTRGCTVLASAPDYSSHSIYWYGGYNGVTATSAYSDAVWVLSVPSFKWVSIASGSTAHGRAGHKCVKPYPDQMMVIGGYPSSAGTTLSCVGDGIVQVFNLNTLKWQTGYNPAVWSNYSVPDVIVAMIGGTGNGGATVLPKTWSNESLATLFQTKYDYNKLTNFYPYATVNVTNNTRPDAEPTTATSSGSGLPSWVAPVLGVVLGLVALSAVVVCILLIRRRKFLKHQESVTGTSEANRYRIMNWVRGADPKTGTVTSDETPSSPFADDMESNSGYMGHHPPVIISEAGGNQVHEMADTSMIQELSGTGLSYLPVAATQLKPSPSTSSHVSGFSQSSSSNGGNITRAVSPLQRDSSQSMQRPDSPPLGDEDQGQTKSRIVSGVSEMTHVRNLSDMSQASRVSEFARPPSPETPGIMGGAVEGRGDFMAGTGPKTPVSPPTPAGADSEDYLSARRTASASESGSTPGSLSRRPPLLDKEGKRRSNFGEMLD